MMQEGINRMTDMQSRTCCSGDKEITVFFMDQPDRDDGLAGYVSGSGLPYEAILCVDPARRRNAAFMNLLPS